MTRRPRLTLTAIAVVGAALSSTACTSDTDRFCEALRDQWDLSSLSEAIQTRDLRSITAGLESLREVQDVAPDDVHDDFRTLIDALSGAVRIVTNAPDSTGETSPVDPTALTRQLEEIDEPAHNVAEFADRNCGLSLGS